MKRRKFIKTTAIGAAATSIPLSTNQLFAKRDDTPQVVFIKNGEPRALVQAVMAELGGMEKFISKGDNVVVKPNMGWDRSPELAANTNPDVIAEVVRLCLAAGAGSVKVFDRTCNKPSRCYRNSRIEAAASEAGAEVLQIRQNRFKNILIDGEAIKEWPIYKDYLEADKVINVPIAKHHSLSRVTLGLKNLMGVMGGRRGSLHNNFHQKIAEIDKHILPTLTIIDAYRILKDNGPSGGNPDDVELTKAMIASPCTVSADFVGLELFGLKPDDVELIRVADEYGLTKYDLKSLKVKRITL